MTSGSPDESAAETAAADPGLDIELLRRRRRRTLAILAGFLIMAGSLAMAFVLLRPRPVDEPALIAAAQGAVRAQIGTGYAFQFGNLRSEVADEAHAVVHGEALVLNDAGGSRRFWFDCALTRREDGAWSAARLTLLPM